MNYWQQFRPILSAVDAASLLLRSDLGCHRLSVATRAFMTATAISVVAFGQQIRHK